MQFLNKERKPQGRVRVLVATLIALLFLACLIMAFAQHRPRVVLKTSPSSSSALPTVINVRAGGNFQKALNNAQPGDVIVLEAGAQFVGTFTLPLKSGSSFITIQSSAMSSLPAVGVRVSPADAANMPKIASPGSGNPALVTQAGAHHFRFIGIEFKPMDANTFAYDLIDFGDGSPAQNSLDKVPHDLVLDRCYIHTYPDQQIKRGVGLNSASTDIINCYIAGFKVKGQEAQAILGYNGPGPYRIINNYLEAAGENVMFGGADASIPNLIPSDIEIRGNYFSKPLAWRGVYTVKNIFELKNAQRVTITGNIFENCWTDAQAGMAIQLTVRNQNGGNPWATVSDVQFTNNIVRHAAGGINILGRDDNHPSGQAHNILIRSNIFDDINGGTWTGAGVFLQITETDGVTVDHNTVFQNGNVIFANGVANTNFTLTNNIFPHNSYGIFGDNHAPDNDSIDTYFPNSTITKNAFIGAGPPPYGYWYDPAAHFPAGNFFPRTFGDVGFTNQSGGNYQLLTGSSYKGVGLDGKDLGCDLNALSAQMKISR